MANFLAAAVNDNANIILVGMMCSGKTAVGKALAKTLNRNFADIDKNAAARAGMSVAAIFNTRGEERFRKLESMELARALKKTGVVVATGGGVVCSGSNIRLMRKSGAVVYLRAPVSLLAARAKSGRGRPLLKECKGDGKKIKNKLAQILKTREHLYTKAAHCVVNISARDTVSAAANNVARAALAL